MSSDMKHTPGPWCYEKGEWEGSTVYPSPYGDPICYTASGDWAREEDDANACLISAAPDLLDALIGITEEIEVIQEHPGEFDPFIFPLDLLFKARAAIAKATGAPLP